VYDEELCDDAFERTGFFGIMIGDDEPINRRPPLAAVNFST